ncbi:TetR/AcrR family transcriptional regulator [Aeromicrobium sp. Sec7.5]|uniref:TetR/AcrR family transcriptional regulator n=1 Tax=Aeromicrobium sp. Sec7.5 TaxID=3121276 RepID=UPI002FE4AEC7
MARASTVVRVHRAVLELAHEVGVDGLTMEGLAAAAGTGKQTLYRSWSSPVHILFDALLAASASHDGRVDVPDSGDLAQDLRDLVAGIVAELTDPGADALMRDVLIRLQAYPDLSAELQHRLLGPQTAAIADRFRRAGVADPEQVTELLLGPIFHRWLLRTGPFTAPWGRAHVELVLRAAG